MNFKIILLIVVSCIVIVFVTQNVSAVTISLLFWSISLSLALLIFFALAIGFALGWFLHSLHAYQKIKKEVAGIQADIRLKK